MRHGLRVITKSRLCSSSNAMGAFSAAPATGQVARSFKFRLSRTAISFLPVTLTKSRFPFCSAAMPSTFSLSKATSPKRFKVRGSKAETHVLCSLASRPPFATYSRPVEASKVIASAAGAARRKMRGAPRPITLVAIAFPPLSVTIRRCLRGS